MNSFSLESYGFREIGREIYGYQVLIKSVASMNNCTVQATSVYNAINRRCAGQSFCVVEVNGKRKDKDLSEVQRAQWSALERKAGLNRFNGIDYERIYSVENLQNLIADLDGVTTLLSVLID